MRNRIAASLIATLLLSGTPAFAQAPTQRDTLTDSAKGLPSELSCEDACRASVPTQCESQSSEDQELSCDETKRASLDVCLRSCED